MLKRTLALLTLLSLSLSVPLFSQEQKKDVLVLTVNGVINPASAEYIGKSIKRANEQKREAVVIELDTPGGLDTSMRDIVKNIIGSEVPVIVYVSPSGARAASAGVFITLAAHVAAMSPGTNIGSAHPVGVGEKMDKVMSEKVTNDAAAYIKSLAERTGRNSKWAEDAVRKSVSATEAEALKEKIIDIVSKDLITLLSAIDGRKVKTVMGEKILKTANANIVREEMNLRHKILNVITDPNVAYMLMLLGFYGLFFELTNPGAIFPGVMGGICLILAFYAFQTLPVNYAGLLLIILAIILFILEIKIISHGVLTIGGVIAMLLGSLMLFESPGPFMKLSLFLILPAVIVTALFFTVVVGLAYKAYKRKPVTGSEGLVGMEGIANTEITRDSGVVLLHGERWSAYSDETISKSEKIVVESVSGLKVKIRKQK
ncbi:MAG: nodulation protein NfeD [Nitrospirae bacterium]|nr:nodulation protein NfeD [Nitrospirota bacterium]MBI3377260.1 nodulation protein NfeD [Nitrospirota bacterium]